MNFKTLQMKMRHKAVLPRVHDYTSDKTAEATYRVSRQCLSTFPNPCFLKYFVRNLKCVCVCMIKIHCGKAPCSEGWRGLIEKLTGGGPIPGLMVGMAPIGGGGSVGGRDIEDDDCCAKAGPAAAAAEEYFTRSDLISS